MLRQSEQLGDYRTTSSGNRESEEILRKKSNVTKEPEGNENEPFRPPSKMMRRKSSMENQRTKAHVDIRVCSHTEEHHDMKIQKKVCLEGVSL